MWQAGQTGILEIILIVVALIWLSNSFRKSRILGKVEEEVNRTTAERARERKLKREQESAPRKPRNKIPPETDAFEDAEYEEVK
jgi:hypothetical protein